MKRLLTYLSAWFARVRGFGRRLARPEPEAAAMLVAAAPVVPVVPTVPVRAEASGSMRAAVAEPQMDAAAQSVAAQSVAAQSVVAQSLVSQPAVASQSVLLAAQSALASQSSASQSVVASQSASRSALALVGDERMNAPVRRYFARLAAASPEGLAVDFKVWGVAPVERFFMALGAQESRERRGPAIADTASLGEAFDGFVWD